MTLQLAFETIREIAASTFDTTFQTLGTVVTRPGRLIKIVNNSDQDIDISIDGTNQHDFLPAGGFTLYDITSNKVDKRFELMANTQFYVRAPGGAGTGDVYLVIIGEAS